MTAPDRRGTRNSKTRQTLLDVTERLMIDEGYAVVGVRRVAREAGVAPALVLYYFPTLDDLFLAVLRRRTDQEAERRSRIKPSAYPLTVLWEMNSHPGTALLAEFMALANHSEAFRAELTAHAERYRHVLLDSFNRMIAEGDLDIGDAPPMAIVVLTTAIARVLVNERDLGLTTGHDETMAFVESLLRRFDGPPDSRTGTKQPEDGAVRP
ncbi:TetR/AcrR family transcriptional regulator [Yinghuangia sp. YIM S10712]|uniref:TetR/AcrR family transcriptional regulator n=1 Tax=Yinghuangia sp. YIM S10712 TaxID=3436930 RepID=UPI003F538802